MNNCSFFEEDGIELITYLSETNQSNEPSGFQQIVKHSLGKFNPHLTRIPILQNRRAGIPITANRF